MSANVDLKHFSLLTCLGGLDHYLDNIPKLSFLRLFRCYAASVHALL